MDALSDVLRAVRLTGAVFFDVQASESWVAETPPGESIVAKIFPGADHLIPYHVITTGNCWASLIGEQPVRLAPGDVVVFPQGDPHLMSSHEGNRLNGGPDSASPKRYPDTVFIGPDGGRDTTLVCGFLGCDARPYNPLLTSLPRRMHVPGIAGGWLSHFPNQVVAESRTGRVGRETMLTRMAELMFIEVVRRHLEQPSSQHAGWLAGLMDAVVGPALATLHEHPEHPWTLAELARTSATSRSVLVERFTRLVGVPPMLYLKRWRLQLAAEQLSRGSAKVATVGTRVGYESEAAFSRAFKQETGLSPAAWRRARHVH